ncbi:hypothetical protein PP915_gp12 [Staphylococcus phage JPL-50]|uniref:Uncharacterized protein n=1 Tax=Staphylococcus phage JPL-50 TaxID=2851077 RepID=A0A8F3HNQ5_9CAUD|nr:hypothetical protein PP915_gp12 [Staphylococcus phage JPL-50]QWY14490.1 hypothetical protein [Staphylococcus phage JPL-50]
MACFAKASNELPLSPLLPLSDESLGEPPLPSNLPPHARIVFAPSKNGLP